MAKTERVAVIGGSISGLAVALALEGQGYEVVVVERDPAPPDIDAGAAFETWARPGVPQFRHAHILLARLQTIVRDRHPKLLAELEEAGLVLSSLEEILPQTLTEIFPARPEDRDLIHLWGRRATFEYVLRRHVGQLPNVRFLHAAKVEGLKVERRDRDLRVTGLEVARDGTTSTIEADVVVDASGKRSKVPEWLAGHGVRPRVDSHPSAYTYVCRHFRLRDPTAWPKRRGTGANLDYLWYGTFYAEHGHFAVAFACPTEEAELAKALSSPEGFDRACRQIPVLAEWTGLAEAESKVLGAGRFENRWTRFRSAGAPEVLGLFVVGDAHVQTNPMYGRGCSSAFVQAHALAEALNRTADTRARSERYYAEVWRLLKPHFDSCVAGDRMFQSRAKRLRGLPVSAFERFLHYGYDRVFIPAVEESPLVAREMMRAMEMRETSSLGLRLAMVFRIVMGWLFGVFRRPGLPRVQSGPTRDDLLRQMPALPAGGAVEAPSLD